MLLEHILNEKHLLQEKLATDCNNNPLLLAEKASSNAKHQLKTLNLKFTYLNQNVVTDKNNYVNADA
jgi:hypothetical protein